MALSGFEQELLGEISREAMRENLTWFAERGLRLGGTQSERDAAGYIVDRLRADGVESRLEDFDAFVSYGDDPKSFGPASVHVRGARAEQIPAKVYAFSASTPPEGVEGDLVEVGIGSHEDYDRLGVDAGGRIVLSDLSFDAPHSEPARVAQARGAAGVIVANWSDRDGPRIHTSTAKWAWGNPTPADLTDGITRIPVVAISRPGGQRLRECLQAGPTRVAIIANASRVWARASQPIAEISGASDRFVLLHCHLDSFGAGVTDNATAVVGLLELARVLQQYRDRLRLSIRIAWWACHEMPYDGSTWHLDRHWDEFRDRCVATLNADSWALSGSRDRLVGMAFAELQDLTSGAIHDAIEREALVLRDFGTKEGEQSFWSIGIPSLFVFSATPDFPHGPITGTWFHTEFDTAEHVDHVALEQLVRVYALLSVRLATADVLPLRYTHAARRVAQLLEEIRPLAPRELDFDTLIGLSGRLEAAARRAERRPDGGDGLDVNGLLIRVGRALNPVVYSVTGPHGQDPVAAGYTARRLPGLRLALEQLAAQSGDELAERAWLTRAMRERNRVRDALCDAVELLSGAAGQGW